jgi:hypothetical protein
MTHPFRARLLRFISAPHRRDFTPPKREDRFVWSRQQNTAEKRFFHRARWHLKNGAREAYSVSMHLLMRRTKGTQ